MNKSRQRTRISNLFDNILNQVYEMFSITRQPRNDCAGEGASRESKVCILEDLMVRGGISRTKTFVALAGSLMGNSCRRGTALPAFGPLQM